MFVLLEVFYKGKKENLCFCAEECAKHFKNFLEAHEKLGNKKYGAYKSASSMEISLCEAVPKGAQINLHSNDIVSMANDIQKGLQKSRAEYFLGIKRDAISFSFTTKEIE